MKMIHLLHSPPSHAIKMLFQIVTRHQKAVAQTSNDAMAQDKLLQSDTVSRVIIQTEA